MQCQYMQCQYNSTCSASTCSASTRSASTCSASTCIQNYTAYGTTYYPYTAYGTTVLEFNFYETATNGLMDEGCDHGDYEDEDCKSDQDDASSPRFSRLVYKPSLLNALLRGSEKQWEARINMRRILSRK